jgi:hypothetical protein
LYCFSCSGSLTVGQACRLLQPANKEILELAAPGIGYLVLIQMPVIRGNPFTKSRNKFDGENIFLELKK